MINKSLYLLITVYCLLAFSSCGNSTKKNTVIVKTNPGQTIFEENCMICHGSDGRLGSMGSKDLSVSTMDKSQMVTIIMNGKDRMAPYKSLLTAEEIDAVADYVQTLKK